MKRSTADGPALVKIAESLGVVREFYVVFLGGRPMPFEFLSFKDAEKEWQHQKSMSAMAGRVTKAVVEARV